MCVTLLVLCMQTHVHYQINCIWWSLSKNSMFLFVSSLVWLSTSWDIVGGGVFTLCIFSMSISLQYSYALSFCPLFPISPRLFVSRYAQLITSKMYNSRLCISARDRFLALNILFSILIEFTWNMIHYAILYYTLYIKDAKGLPPVQFEMHQILMPNKCFSILLTPFNH